MKNCIKILAAIGLGLGIVWFALAARPAKATGPEIGQGKPVTVSSQVSGSFPATNTNDGNRNSYWEGLTGQYPAYVTIDLQATYTVDTVTVELPAAWGYRYETIGVEGSANGTTYTTIKAGQTISFGSSPILFPTTTARFIRLKITSNSGAPAAQLSEFKVYGTPTNPTPPPTPNVLPTVSTSATPVTGTAPLSVNFVANATDTDGTIASYAWNYGDGSSSTIATTTPTHTFTATGTFVTTVTVTDNLGGQASSSVSVTVTAPAEPQQFVRTWSVQSVDGMKLQQDALCNQVSTSTINSWLDKAVDVGATHVAVSVPYDSVPGCDANAYNRKWITLIRQHNQCVWHRHKDNAFEGFYGVTKHRSPDGVRHIKNEVDWIIANPDLIQPCDIFTPFAEPQNGGISGVTWCGSPANCQFGHAADFNEWIRTVQYATKVAMKAIGKQVTSTFGDPTGVFVGAYGFDGFIVAGLNNPDWEGKTFLEPATVAAMDNVIAIDHYPSPTGNMGTDLDKIHAVWPNAKLVIGEIGTINQSTPAARQAAVEDWFAAFAARPYIPGVNYWHLGFGGNEALINSDFTEREHYQNVKKFFKKLVTQ